MDTYKAPAKLKFYRIMDNEKRKYQVLPGLIYKYDKKNNTIIIWTNINWFEYFKCFVQFLLEELGSRGVLFKIDGFVLKNPDNLKRILSIKTDRSIITGHNKVRSSEITIYFEEYGLWADLKNKFSEATIKYTFL